MRKLLVGGAGMSGEICSVRHALDPLSGGAGAGLPSRPVALEEGEWDLGEIAVEDWRESLTRLKQEAAELVRLAQGFRAGGSAIEAREFLESYNLFSDRWDRAQGYFELRKLVNSADNEAQAVSTAYSNAFAEISAEFLHFDRWLGRLTDEEAREVISLCTGLEQYVSVSREEAKHLLTHEEENIIAIKDPNGVYALGEVYEALTSMYKFPFRGEQVLESDLLPALEDPDAAVREDAYTARIGRYAEDKSALGIIYSAVVNNWRLEHVERRGYENPIAVQAAEAEISGEVITSLFAVCERNLPVIQEYLELKRRALGLEKLTRFDVKAPLPFSETRIDFAAGAKLVFEAFGKFSPEMRSALEEVFYT